MASSITEGCTFPQLARQTEQQITSVQLVIELGQGF